MSFRITGLTVALAMAISGSQVMAQDYDGAEGQQQQGQSADQAQKSADDFSDSELKRFVNLQDEIGKIREEYVDKIESAESEDKARELQQEAQSAMVSAIEEAGMSVQDYNAIAVAYNSNPDVQKRVDSMAGEND